MTMTDREARERVERLEPLLAGLERLAEPGRSSALDAVSGLAELYGEALRRILAALPAEQALALAGDELVSQLLLVHGLHPMPLEERVRAAVEDVRPYVEKHGGELELVAVAGGRVRVRLASGCNGCGAPEATLRAAVEDAIRGAAPEVEQLEAGEQRQPRVKGIALPVAGAAS